MASSSSGPSWKDALASVLYTVFSNLSGTDLLAVSKTCYEWEAVSKFESLWRKCMRKEFGVNANKELAPGAKSWLQEYKRLQYQFPRVETYSKQFDYFIQDVAFSADGKMFVTSTHDGFIRIWASDNPARMIHELNTRKFGWRIPLTVSFNESATMLYASGYVLSNENSHKISHAENIVLSIGDSLVPIFIIEQPTLMHETLWFNDQYVLSNTTTNVGNEMKYFTLDMARTNSTKDIVLHPIFRLLTTKFILFYHMVIANLREDVSADNSTSNSKFEDEPSSSGDNNSSSCFYDKLLIYTSAFRANFPHAIEFKRFKSMEFFKNLKPDMTVEEILEFRESNPASEDFDTVDKVIDLNACIIKISLSPDHRYLYVNSRKFVEEHERFPKLNEQIDVHVVDLKTFEILPTHIEGLKATKQDRIQNPLSISVSDYYIASGHESANAYIWDRHYEVPLMFAKKDETGGICHVIFNPADTEMLITVSLKKILRVYRSDNKNPQKLQKIPKLN